MFAGERCLLGGAEGVLGCGRLQQGAVVLIELEKVVAGPGLRPWEWWEQMAWEPPRPSGRLERGRTGEGGGEPEQVRAARAGAA